MSQAVIEDRIELRAHLTDADFHLGRLRSSILDSLTGPDDEWLRVTLMAEVDAIGLRLAKAML